MSDSYFNAERSEHEHVRERVALQRSFQLYEQYAPKQASGLLRIDLSTLKRWTKHKRIRSNAHGERGVRYIGTEIADIIIKGTRPWPGDTTSENSSSANTGLISEKAPPPGIDAGSKVDAQSALRLARQTLKTQSKS